jgi:hypothetical protein
VPCLALVWLTGCNVLQSGLSTQGQAPWDAAQAQAQEAGQADTAAAKDVGEPPGVHDSPPIAGCSDGSREGFRDVVRWPLIAGCAGAFEVPGVLDSKRSCQVAVGDELQSDAATNCSVADLCAAGWHVCRDGRDVALHSPTGDCEGCVLPGEQRFFVAAKAASPMGTCSADPDARNDLHGCGGLGQPEMDECAPLDRRMSFADCEATHGVWQCGTPESDSLQEAVVVTKPGTGMGGALCCSD